jgi:uncharacterized protein (TIGR00645 family)
MTDNATKTRLTPLSANLIFFSRWLQLPLYLGLILAQCVYVFHFWVELVDLIGAALGNQAALQHILDAVSTGGDRPTKLNETTIMLVVLGLIDVVMISNLLIMVIIGGYETLFPVSGWTVTRISRNGCRTSMLRY